MTLVLLIFLIALPITGQSTETFFHPLAATNARTIQKGTLSLSRAPLGNLNSHFLTSSLTFGAFERIEVGTAPLFYAIPDHKYNFIVKYNFYRGNNFDWALSYGKTVFRTEVQLNDKVERPDLEMTGTQLVVNYHPEGSLWAFGLSGTISCGQIKSDDVYVKIYSFRCETEHGVDVQYQTKTDQWITVGHGKTRETGITPYESTDSGAGVAYSWFRSGKFISRPSIGIYQHWDKDMMYLFTTTFYEKK